MLDIVRESVRALMRVVARILNSLTGGRLSPNAVTMISLLGHVLIVGFLVSNHTLRAAVLLVVFGLMDTLDGELARLQGKAGNSGMVLDASTDRMKEALLYAAIAYRFAANSQPTLVLVTVLALGGSFAVSYVKAKAETAIASHHSEHTTVNKLFQEGFMRYEIRMALLVFGLCWIPSLPYMIVVIGAFAWSTAFGRLSRVMNQLK